MSAKLARSAGIAPAMAFCATLRSRPRTDAIFAIMSGVRHCITTETKFVAMAILPSRVQVFSQLVAQSGLRLQSLITLYYNLPGLIRAPQAATIWEPANDLNRRSWQAMSHGGSFAAVDTAVDRNRVGSGYVLRAPHERIPATR